MVSIDQMDTTSDLNNHSLFTTPQPLLKWGIIGCGRISHRFMQGMAAVDESEVTMVWSRRPQTVNDFAKQYNVTGCNSVDELLLSDIDAVYIATLPDSHAHYAKLSLNAGKHVLCEKPATLNLAQLQEVLALAKATGLLFMEGMKPPFYPLYQKLRAHLQQDPIGDIGYVRAGSSVAGISRDHPNYSYQLAGGSLMAIGIYEAFLAIDWLGDTLEVQTLGRYDDLEVDMFSIFQSRHTNGFAQLYCGMDLHGKGDALICGTLGNITIHKNWWNPVKATIDYFDGRVVELDEPFIAGGLNYEIEHFNRLIRAGQTESAIVPHDLSRQMIAMLDKARQQIGLKFTGE